MPKIQYVSMNFRAATLEIIDLANRILQEYKNAGYSLTLRQLYYQFVARGYIENSDRSYKNLGDAINNARLAGLLDWNMIIDRTRNLNVKPHWYSPADIVAACANQYSVDMWENQKYYVEVWIEKDALIGVIERPCKEFDIPYFSCRGYTSQSEMWAAARRYLDVLKFNSQKKIVILHFGDHDPSGIDMSGDIQSRITMFLAEHMNEIGGGYQPDDVDLFFQFRRIALNWDHIEAYNPPPNPAKTTDKRFKRYLREFGEESWELDSLPPNVLSDLITNNIAQYIDQVKWDKSRNKEIEGRRILREVAENIGKNE